MAFLRVSLLLLYLVSTNAFINFISRTAQQRCRFPLEEPNLLVLNARRKTKNMDSTARSKRAKMSPTIQDKSSEPTLDLAYDDIFQKYGVGQATGDDKDTRNQDAEQPALFGQKVLSKLSQRAQSSVDSILTVGASVSLLFVMLCGIGISLSAMKIVYPSLPDSFVNSAASEFLSSAFTPSLVIFLVFSSTFGLLKLAQVNSGQTNYTRHGAVKWYIPGKQHPCTVAMRALKFYNLRGVSIFDQLCFEELLLRTTNDNCVVFNSRIAENSIVLGFSGKPLELLNVNKVKRDNLQVIRRFTGGGTVIVDENTVFASLILNSADIGCPPYPREIMKWTEEEVYGPVFQDLTATAPAASTTTSNNAKFSLLENDYVWGDRKVGGNAQTITKGRWVHHTSFLWKFDPLRMGYLKMPSKRPVYRADRPHTEFLTEVASQLPEGRRTPEHFAQAMYTHLSKQFQIDMHPAGETNCSAEDLPVMENAEFQYLHEMLKAENPTFAPRTFYIEDLPSE